MPTKIEKDALTGRETTGHEWDGLKELNTPLPSWWLYTFYACIAFAIVYCILYPSIPGLRSHFGGVLGYSQRGELAKSLAEANAAQSGLRQKIAATSLEDIRKSPDLFNFALAGGKAAFNENCAACHKTGGAGGVGYPSLADDDWLWGGTLAEIEQTLKHGIRSANDPDTRNSLMPRFGADGLLNAAQISDAADYVLSLSGKAKPGAAVDRGTKLFAENCAVCHGDKGAGNKELGAPNLTDQIWLYGSDKASIVQTISLARNGVMPAWEGRLDPTTIKMLVMYVHSLGGGQ